VAIISEHDVEWTGAGLAITPMRQRLFSAPVRTADPIPPGGVDPLDATQPTTIVVRWRELAALDAVSPWPNFRLRWRFKGGEDEATFVPSGDRVAFEAMVVALAAHVEKMSGRATQNGWLLEPVYGWEAVANLPSELPPTAEGAYRTAGRAPGEKIVARRTQESALEGMIGWLASGTARWRSVPREVVLTEEHVWVRRRGGAIERMPRRHLTRAGYANASGDYAYGYGRRDRLVLPWREGCLVSRALEADVIKYGARRER
jgi:hypothetical protein